MQPRSGDSVDPHRRPGEPIAHAAGHGRHAEHQRNLRERHEHEVHENAAPAGLAEEPERQRRARERGGERDAETAEQEFSHAPAESLRRGLRGGRRKPFLLGRPGAQFRGRAARRDDAEHRRIAELEASVGARFRREDQRDRTGEGQRLEGRRVAFADPPAPEEGGHDPGAHRGRRRARHLHVEPEQREDGDTGRDFRQARAARQPEQSGRHAGDVQAADREEVQRAGRREGFLGFRGQERRTPQHRRGEQSAAIGIMPRHLAQPGVEPTLLRLSPAREARSRREFAEHPSAAQLQRRSLRA